MKVQLALCLVLGALVACKGAPLETRTWWPDNPSLEFITGKVSTAVVGVRNPGKPVNLTASYAQLALVSNPEGSIYNFSGVGYQLPELTTGEETVVEYALNMPLNMPTREFILRLFLWSTVNGQHESELLFNETINVVEEPKLIDTELLGLYAILLALFAVAVYYLMNYLQDKGILKKPKKPTASVPASSSKEDWLKGTTADKSLKKSK